MRRREFIKDAVATLYSESLPAEAWVVSGRKGTGINLIHPPPLKRRITGAHGELRTTCTATIFSISTPKSWKANRGLVLRKELTEQTIFGPDVLAQTERWKMRRYHVSSRDPWPRNAN